MEALPVDVAGGLLARASGLAAVAGAGPAAQPALRALLARARELFGANPVEPPVDIAPDPDAARTWLL
jgi:hypothetical protein